VLTGSCRISVMSQGRPNSFGVRFTDVWANKGGRWQMVAGNPPALRTDGADRSPTLKRARRGARHVPDAITG
jgi:hypothetical protein